ncbi:hypothetical protein PC118_g4253 [Phytophthora cactorum]|uniref:Uncharacterized protein n=1 Tax=Phytophthora cactorum TaxID=29920 RepID=A0A8T0ZDI0_9STRA|nr:hypothetical protein PC112_g7899 [Phytophthora cactorum]KAG2860344.1 hypothetical protein PC113_g8148 [Phytophthora cactorum]KAG2914196.1 hypothetical protein PC114_g8281 [Phytophthora cactorum]KAG2929272.1 hypothetical protein PC115_g6937 [Phytophthora cactorum]KAG2945805.1 hypothetical protein PC117_g8152 [Phytophthora cactorum]
MDAGVTPDVFVITLRHRRHEVRAEQPRSVGEATLQRLSDTYEMPSSPDRDTTDEQVVLVDAAVGDGEFTGADVGELVGVVLVPPRLEHFKKGALCVVALDWQNRHCPLRKQPKPLAAHVGFVAATAEIPTPWSPTETSDRQSTVDSTGAVVFDGGDSVF